MKKKRAIRNYVFVGLFIAMVLCLCFISFPVPFTNYRFEGIANLNLGLEFGGGVKNTYELEVADWYDGTEEEAHLDAVNRVQKLLNKYYADAKVYLSGESNITIEVPDNAINDYLVIGFIEMKSESGAEAEAKVTGQDIEKVEYTMSGSTHGVYIEFTKEGQKKFQELTKVVAESDAQTMYIYMDKNYDEPFSQTKVTEENTYGYTFISGSSITTKESGELYANKIASSMIGINMSTEFDATEVAGQFGNHTRLIVTIATAVLIVASIVIAFVLFRELGLVSSASVLFGLMVSVLISAVVDMQITFAGWLAFMLGYILNYVLHMYYLSVIKDEFAKGKKFTVSFTSGYRRALFNILDMLLIISSVVGLSIMIPSNLVRTFAFNMLVTIPGTAYTAMYLNKVLAVNYTAFNSKDHKKLNFAREEQVDEIK